MKHKVIYISGVSCTGKTTLGTALAGKLNAFLIPTDVVKYTLRYERQKNLNSIIHTNTFSAYKNYAIYSPNNLYKYALKHSETVMRPVKPMIKYFSNVYTYVIVEGAHLFPEFLHKEKFLDESSLCFLLNMPKSLHNRSLKTRGLTEISHGKNKEVIRTLQKKLLKSAKKIKRIHIIKNSNKLGALSEIMRYIKNDSTN